MATMENLPNDALTDIFTRLPAKLLAQMRCVSKPFNALISHPLFITSHLKRSMHKNDTILLSFYSKLYFRTQEPFTAYSSQSSTNIDVTSFIKLPVDSPSSTNKGKLIGSVNGLICFSYGPKKIKPKIYIWNPSLSVVTTLPPAHTLSPHERTRSLRFGFDPKTDDYKVIHISTHNPPVYIFNEAYFNKKEDWLQVQVYSMKNDSWKLVTQRFPPDVKSIRDEVADEICMDGQCGFLHWLCSGHMSRVQQKELMIVAFDLVLETFREIPLPSSVPDNNSDLVTIIGILNEKLCIITTTGFEIEVWAMGDYGVAESWEKRYSFSEPEYICQIELRFVLYVDSLVWVAPANRSISITSLQFE